jgi:hypothetical protein
VSRFRKLLDKLLSGTSDANFTFEELRYLLLRLGFDEDISGSHHMFSRDGVEEQANLQRGRGRKDAKPYQVRQVRDLILKYNLAAEEEE